MKKVLLFGFEDLPEILKAVSAAEKWGAEAVTVSRESWGCTLEELARGKRGGGNRSLVPMGKMLVFCGLERELDGLLADLRQAGVTGLKAVMTPVNQSWTPERLYRELEREYRAMGGGK